MWKTIYSIDLNLLIGIIGGIISGIFVSYVFLIELSLTIPQEGQCISKTLSSPNTVPSTLKRSLQTGHFNNTCPSSSVGILIVKTSVSLMAYLPSHLKNAL